jgi:nucleoside-diphosphate-sugar epimerase
LIGKKSYNEYLIPKFFDGNHMQYFLTGATGFVGSWVAEKLVEKGETVICLVRKTSNLRWLKHLSVKYHYGSLLDMDSLETGIEEADYILHCGGVTKALSIEEYYRGNVDATENLLKATAKIKPDIKKFVHISSQAAVGPSESITPIEEIHACNPLTYYGKSKLETEHVVHQFFDRLPITVLRPSTVYGPRDTDVFEAFRNVKYGVNLKIGKIEQYVSMIHVFDLAEGIIHAAENEKGMHETYFICNDQTYSWTQVIGEIKKLMDKKPFDLSVPYWFAYGIASVIEFVARVRGKPTILDRQKMKELKEQYWTASNQKLRSQLGFSPKLSIEQGLRITYDWYKENLWI